MSFGFWMSTFMGACLWGVAIRLEVVDPLLAAIWYAATVGVLGTIDIWTRRPKG